MKTMADLAEAIGMTKEDMTKIVAEQVENAGKLRGCDFHQFHSTEHADKTAARMNLRFTCIHCQGTVGYGSILWYERGVHAVDRNVKVWLP